MRPPKLKRSLGLWMATALVIGNMIGSGVFLLPAALAGTAGPISVVGSLFTGVGAMLLALVFARLGRPFPRPAARTSTPPRVRRFRRLPDGVGLLDRRLGRQRGDRHRVRQLPRCLLGRDRTNNLSAALDGIG